MTCGKQVSGKHWLSELFLIGDVRCLQAAVIHGNQSYTHKRAPSSGGHTQPAELILCTSSSKRATFKKPDAARSLIYY